MFGFVLKLFWKNFRVIYLLLPIYSQIFVEIAKIVPSVLFHTIGNSGRLKGFVRDLENLRQNKKRNVRNRILMSNVNVTFETKI